MISRIDGRYSRLNILHFICHHTSPFPVYPFLCMWGNLTSNDFYWTEMWRKMKAGITFRANWILFCFPGFHISNKSFICAAPKRKSLCCRAKMTKNPKRLQKQLKKVKKENRIQKESWQEYFTGSILHCIWPDVVKYRNGLPPLCLWMVGKRVGWKYFPKKMLWSEAPG